MAKTPGISEAEWEVMEVLWQHSPLTAAEVARALKNKNWAANTVRTLLARLVRKKALRHAPDGNRYLYSAAVRRNECVQEEVEHFSARLFGGAIQPLLLHFVRSKKLSPEDIAELKSILDGREEK